MTSLASSCRRLTLWMATSVATLAASFPPGAAAAAASATYAGRGCASISAPQLHSVRVVAAPILAGTFVTPEGERLEVPAFCRVRGEVRPTADSRISFELWMPAEGWNGRYYQLGNGGFAGNLHLPSLAAELWRGNAAALTDTGHRASSYDASWAENHPQRIIDYGYRSLKVTGDVARVLLKRFYGEPARHRYFVGCSGGGRQALIAAQRYPRDWDGIVAGAPALDWSRQLATFAWLQNALRRDSGSWIAPEKLPAIERAALASCSPEARVRDGIPEDPRFCPFEPRAILCRGPETSDCLTVAQVIMIDRIQDGPSDRNSGIHLAFGFEATSANVPDNWSRWILDPRRDSDTQLKFAEQFFRFMVHDERTWTVERFVPSHDFTRARDRPIGAETLSQVLDAASTDLASFARQGGRLLMYFGWADALLSPRTGLDYYQRVTKRMGGVEPTRAFFRLFMVPGMLHCQGGPGANAFGQAAVSPGLRDDSTHDIRRALERWVEKGAAPDWIVATKYSADDPGRGVETSRVLCAFPQISAMENPAIAGNTGVPACVDPPADDAIDIQY